MSVLYNSLAKINYKFWNKISTSTAVSSENLGFFRCVFGAFLLIFYPPDYSWLGSMPKALFNPPPFSIAAFVNGFPSSAFFSTMEVFLLCCNVLIIAGIKSRISSLLYVAGTIICLNFQFSFGKIDHSFLVYALLACVAFTDAGSHFALLPDKKRNSFHTQKSIALFSVLLCFAFFSAGYEKARFWMNPDMDFSGAASWLYGGYFDLNRTAFLSRYFINAPFAIFKLMDVSAVLFELSALFFLLHSKKSWLLWLFVACLFHILNTLVLNIDFLLNSMAYLVFADLKGIRSRTQQFASSSKRKTIMHALVFMFIAGWVIWRYATGVYPSLSSTERLWICLGVWILVATIIGRNYYKERSPRHR
ncbi:MAG: hypothetical protein ACO1NW_05615 [Chitinophagaceae bacterium]